ncbi:MAG TPA: ester cyclase [Vicinamibacteria bacterium]|nr:ester cyclase [Vicinamibacteria bacterium]
MDTTMLSVAATLGAPPEEVFDILMSSDKHSELTNAESVIENRVGGRFSYFGGGVSGVFEELEPNRRIVQALRAADWPEEHHAKVSYELLPIGDGHRTHVKVLEKGVPTARLDDVVHGWQAYWEAFAVYLRERKVSVVRRFVEEYKNNQNPDVVDELVANDCAVHIPLPGLPQGREGMRKNGRLVCSAFPDVHVTGEFLLTEGDIVIERANAVATHKGELLGTPPTGKRVTWTELHAYRVKGDQITEVWSEADFVGMLAQIGAVKPPAG